MAGVGPFVVRRPGRNCTHACTGFVWGNSWGKVAVPALSDELLAASSRFMQAYINPTLCKTTSRKPRRPWGCFAVLLRLSGKFVFSKDPFFMGRDKHNFGKTMVRPICESTSHLKAGLEIPPLLTRCSDSVPVLPQHSWNRHNVGDCAIKWAQSWRVCGASAKFYLHAHCFLYKLDYNSKWNTLEKKNKTKTKSY